MWCELSSVWSTYMRPSYVVFIKTVLVSHTIPPRTEPWFAVSSSRMKMPSMNTRSVARNRGPVVSLERYWESAAFTWSAAQLSRFGGRMQDCRIRVGTTEVCHRKYGRGPMSPSCTILTTWSTFRASCLCTTLQSDWLPVLSNTVWKSLVAEIYYGFLWQTFGLFDHRRGEVARISERL